MRQGIYSPRWLTDAARNVMGRIDLDPCSCLLANCVVQAETFYTEEENGLALPWFGNVYLNPPFEQSRLWVYKLQHEPQVKQVVFISSFSASWYGWFRWVWDNFVLLLPRKRTVFWHPDRRNSTPQSFVAYSGPNEQRFVEVFRDRGTILRRID